MSSIPGVKAHLLVVEDHQGVCDVIQRALEAHGYDVTCTGDCDDAIWLLEHAIHSFDLMITDLVLPKRDGVQLAELSKKLKPSLLMLFMTGYLDHPLLQKVPAGLLIPKPFSASQLRARVERVLCSHPSTEERALDEKKTNQIPDGRIKVEELYHQLQQLTVLCGTAVHLERLSKQTVARAREDVAIAQHTFEASTALCERVRADRETRTVNRLRLARLRKG
jgi:DNA-binding NtrC family response regulator